MMVKVKTLKNISVIFWISLMHCPIIAPSRGSHGLKDILRQARRVDT